MPIHPKKKNDDDSGGILDQAKARLMLVQGQAGAMGIIEFIRTIVDLSLIHI